MTLEALASCTADEAPSLRAVAFYHLVARHPSVPLLPILLKHLADTDAVEGQRGSVLHRMPVGEAMIFVAWEKLTPSERDELAAELVLQDSPLPRRQAVLRSHALPDRALHHVRKQAQAGDDVALRSLARFAIAADAPLLIRRLAERRDHALNDVLDACAAHHHPSLLPALRSCVRNVAPDQPGSRGMIRRWLAAVVAVGTADAATLLGESETLFHAAGSSENIAEVLLGVLGTQDIPVFADLRRTLSARRR